MQKENKNFEDLMIDYFSGSISEMDQQYLFDLIKSSSDFKIQFVEMVKLRAITFTAQIESEKKKNYNLLIDQISTVPTFYKSSSWLGNLRRIAAIITLIISVSVASYYVYKDITSQDDSTICFETFAPLGSQTKIILPDSTIVWINSGSSLKYNQAFGKKDREVILAGEGYFEVKIDKTKPFIVHTDSLNVNVLGTIFNVRAYKEDDNVIVNLFKGSVNVSLSKPGSAGLHIMKPNEKLVFSKQTKKIESSEVSASSSALWTTGKLCFVDATIEQISKDLERKYSMKIRIENEKIKKELFSGSLNLDLTLEEILSYIDVDKKFKLNQVGDTIYIGIK